MNALGYCDAGLGQSGVRHRPAALQHISNLYYSPVHDRSWRKPSAKQPGFCQGLLCKLRRGGQRVRHQAVRRKYSVRRIGAGAATEIVTLNNSFHGRTVTTLVRHRAGRLPPVLHPLYRGLCLRGGRTTWRDVQAAGRAVNTCAVMIELIQGEGGVLPAGQGICPGAWRAFCREQRYPARWRTRCRPAWGARAALYC